MVGDDQPAPGVRDVLEPRDLDAAVGAVEEIQERLGLLAVDRIAAELVDDVGAVAHGSGATTSTGSEKGGCRRSNGTGCRRLRTQRSIIRNSLPKPGAASVPRARGRLTEGPYSGDGPASSCGAGVASAPSSSARREAALAVDRGAGFAGGRGAGLARGLGVASARGWGAAAAALPRRRGGRGRGVSAVGSAAGGAGVGAGGAGSADGVAGTLPNGLSPGTCFAI